MAQTHKNFQILVSTGNGMITFVHVQAEIGMDLVSSWQQQRISNQAYFAFPTGKLLMHHVIGVIE